jgi:hypothetical protein
VYCHRNFDRQRGRERERRAHARICFVQFFDTPNSLSLSRLEKKIFSLLLCRQPLSPLSCLLADSLSSFALLLFLTLRCPVPRQKKHPTTKPGALDFLFFFRELNHLRPLRRRPLLRAPRLRRRGADHGGARGSPWVRVVADQGVQAVPGAGERRGAVHEVRELG